MNKASHGNARQWAQDVGCSQEMLTMPHEGWLKKLSVFRLEKRCQEERRWGTCRNDF